MGMLTGADGTRIISVTRPDTHGTRTAIIAALYENAAVSASIDTIFTVITSPDVDVARMWGAYVAVAHGGGWRGVSASTALR